MINFKTIAAAAALSTVASLGAADTWTLNPAQSNLSFGSVKNDYIGEVHSFTALSGTVSDAGIVSVDVDLTSVQTNIDIRNERMMEFVFEAAQTANLSAEIDMAAMDAMAVGDMATMDAFGNLSLLNEDIPVDVPLFVVRVAQDKVLVTSNGMLMLATDDIGVDGGIDMLQELAGLDAITRVTPVTLRLVFETAM